MPKLEKYFSSHREFLDYLSALHDIVCIFISAFFFNLIFFETFKMESGYIISTIFISLVIALVNINFSFNISFRRSLILNILRRFFLFLCISYGSVDTTFSLIKSDLSYVWVVCTLTTSFILSVCNRLIFSIIVYRIRMKKKCSRSVFLIGSTESVTSIDHRMNQVVGYNSIDISIAPISRQTFIFKRTVDIFLSILISFAIIPASLFIALIIKITSSGPVLFTQYRTGINGQHFKLYKFRTMKVHQEEGGQVTQAVENDTRTTKFGRFLRKTSLDELPQILNVFQGNMSLVGPRPHAIPHNEYYKDLIGFYMQRQMVKPGVTGWAQINGYRGQTDTLEKMKRRVEYDIWYINNWSLLLDLKIIIKTVFKGFINKNA